MPELSILLTFGYYLLLIIIPLFLLYLVYSVVTRAFEDMGFSTGEALIIIFASLLLGGRYLPPIIINGFNLSDIYLFTYNNWLISINIGGALIPIILCVYLIYKNKFALKKLLLGLILVSAITFFVTSADPNKGIISYFPYWLLPAVIASLSSVFFQWKNYCKAAPFAYVVGTLGVLIGADVLRLPELLSYHTEKLQPASIGGANVLDMVFITGILAVVIDSILMFRQRRKTSCRLSENQ